MHTLPLRVGVLMGGKSIEREVSLNTGRTICDHIDTARYQCVPIFQTGEGKLFELPWHFLHRGKISDFEHRLPSQAQPITWESLRNLVDLIYIAQHGRFAEDGALQGLLEILRIPYVGSKVMASALGMDKHMQKSFLRAAGVAVPASITLMPYQFDSWDRYAIRFPCIVKPSKEGSSLGVALVRNPEDLVAALVKASTITPDIKQPVLIEEYIEGMEFSCIILTDYSTGSLLPLPPTEIVHEAGSDIFDYEQKYMPGRAIKHTPARCSIEQIKHIQDTCVHVMQTLGITNLARIDGFLTQDNRIVIIDPNTFAGMSPSSFTSVQAAEIGMSHTQLINHLLETELHAYTMRDVCALSGKSAQLHAPKLRVAVLMGGSSNEKEISLESGRNIVYKLSPHTYEALPIFLDTHLNLYVIDQHLLVRNTTHEITQGLTPAMRISWDDLRAYADVVFIGLHGGEGENGCVQGALEMLGLPYNGSGVLTSALCMDKFKTNQFLKQQGFSVPDGVLISCQQWEQTGTLPQEFSASYPLIVKPHDDGCSVLVFKVHTDHEVQQALAQIFSAGKSHALIEEYIHGMELTVGVIGNTQPRALPPSRTLASHGILSIEEKFLPGAGENQTPAPLPEDTLLFIQATIERAYQALNCKGYARIDCFYQSADTSPTGHERVILLEVNTLPGMTPATCLFHQAAEVGIKPMDFIDLIIRLGLEEHGKVTVRDTASNYSINQETPVNL